MNLGGALGIAIMGSAATTASPGALDVSPAMIAGACVAAVGSLVVATILPRGRANTLTAVENTAGARVNSAEPLVGDQVDS